MNFTADSRKKTVLLKQDGTLEIGEFYVYKLAHDMMYPNTRVVASGSIKHCNEFMAGVAIGREYMRSANEDDFQAKTPAERDGFMLGVHLENNQPKTTTGG